MFWIHANSIERFREGYHNIVDECNIKGQNEEKCDKMVLFKNWLEKEHKNWLMIIDNADEASLFASKPELSLDKTGADQSILEHLPESNHGSILITTRNRAAGVKFTRNRSMDLVEVSTMTEHESSRLIRSTLSDDIPTDEEIHEISDLLGHLPLALAQATAFMQENVLTISEYIELYKDSDETQMDLLSEPFETLGRDSRVPNAVATTLIVSVNQIKKQDPKAIEILSLVAFVDQNNIPKSLVQAKVKRALDLTKALGTLKAFSLITANERGDFSLHRLVQLVLRKWLIIEGKFEDQAIQTMDIIAELFPNATFDNWAACKAYFPHAQSVLAFIPEMHGKLLRRRLHLQGGMAYYLWSQGYCNEAEKLDVLIVEENKKEFGREHPETLESMAALASTLEDQGKWAQAAELDRHVVATREKNLGPTHELTLTSKSNLATICGRQGYYDEAEKLLLEVLENRLSVFGAEHESVVSAKAALASIYIDLDRLEEAEEFATQAWHWRKKILGAEYDATLDAQSTLGIIYERQGRLEEAETLTLQTTQMKENILGPEHPQTLLTKGNLINIYHNKEEWGKAEELALDVIAAKTQRMGLTHHDTLVERQRLACIYFSQGHVERAGAMEDKILKDSIDSLGSDHPFAMTCMNETAITRKHQNRDTEAIQLMTQVVSRRERILGPFHDDTLMALKTLCDWCGSGEAIERLLEAEKNPCHPKIKYTVDLI